MKNLAKSEELQAAAQLVGHLGNWESFSLTLMFWGSEEMFMIWEWCSIPVSLFGKFPFRHIAFDRDLLAPSSANACKHESTCGCTAATAFNKTGFNGKAMATRGGALAGERSKRSC
jgi:hypothetical protein